MRADLGTSNKQTFIPSSFEKTEAEGNQAEVLRRPDQIDEQDVIDLIQKDDAFVCRVLVALYNLQEADEKRDRTSRHKNRVGFSSPDAAIFSDFARYINKSGYLTPRQLGVCRGPWRGGIPCLAKYRKQIIRLGLCCTEMVSNEREVAA